MSTHPITDIHDTEKEAKKSIEDAKKQNQKQILDTREKEEKKFTEFEEGEKTAGKEKIMKAKEEASKICKDKLASGEKEINTMTKNAGQREDQAIRSAVKSFSDYVGVSA
jgi:vacuolar-type H+-ATPase subunit H